MKDQNSLIAEIKQLKELRHAVIMAHNYVNSDVQQIADFCGDSLELSLKAANLKSDTIVMCGVRFMAETAKLLSPQAMVLLANAASGCPMADMVDAGELKKYKEANPDTLLVAYVNTTAEVKSLVDICCTSGNAEKIVKSIPADRKIMFLPDRNLGANLINKLHRHMELWHGCCPIHNAVTPEMIAKARAGIPGAVVMVHPECRPEVTAVADVSLSTGAMLKYVTGSSAKKFIVGTEIGIIFRLQQENPDKEFYPLLPELRCADMKLITLQDIAETLRTMRNQIEIPGAPGVAGRHAIERMLEIK